MREFKDIKVIYGTEYSLCAHTHTCRVRSCDTASKLRTLSSVAPELASWLILKNTALNFSPKTQRELDTKILRHQLQLNIYKHSKSL